MEAISLESLNENSIALRKIVERISEVVLEDEMELSEEVIREIDASRKKPRSSFISQEDIEAEFLNGN